jgi:hypothetical protein
MSDDLVVVDPPMLSLDHDDENTTTTTTTTTNNNNNNSTVDTSDLEDAPCCRVCHCEGEPGRELFFPCKCDGTIKYVHQDCLMAWIAHSQKQKPAALQQRVPKCELCGEPFHFTNVYKEDTPFRLTVWELVKELVPRIQTWLVIVFHALVLLALWGVAYPLFTAFWFRLWICHALHSQAHETSLECITGPLEGWVAIPLLEWIWKLADVWLFGINALTVMAGVSFFAIDIGKAVVTVSLAVLLKF